MEGVHRAIRRHGGGRGPQTLAQHLAAEDLGGPGVHLAALENIVPQGPGAEYRKQLVEHDRNQLPWKH